ncbi:N-acetylglucosaminyl-phosphatidylinositol de-N-acetylase isoform X2 [Athalia rosae]|uniref:N-acetylglucosaminyl-phosphatidylinositol de-N-acetylase isoform X2 n=1 Tax=Athalia rosae TaxID=37344 RepID=UPI000625AFF3|nr:N-acetylglucosaminyl-phosphatidylinositol de-N-acetylase isoform X2 [Athalia rosae]
MDMSLVNTVANYVNVLLNETVWYFKEIAWQLVIAVIAYLCVCIFLYILLLNVSHKAWQLPGPPARVLLVIAHPDDEVMFFGPMIYWMINQRDCEVYLLCLTIGGDKKRKEELWASARILGIPEANVTILMSTQLPDDPKVQWPKNIVAETILLHVESYRINAVVTFDKRGVSGHRNHISIFYGVASLCMENKLPTYCKMYVLETVNILRKYTLVLDLPISLLSTSYWYLLSFKQRRNIHVDGHESSQVPIRLVQKIVHGVFSVRIRKYPPRNQLA